MPSEHRSSYVMTPDSLRDLERVYHLANQRGVDLSRIVHGQREMNPSAVMRYALAEVAGGTASPCASTGRDRVRQAIARSGLATRQVADAAGCSPSHVRAVVSGCVPLSPDGALCAWVEGLEAQS